MRGEPSLDPPLGVLLHDKLVAIFADSLGLELRDIVDEMKYGEIPEWDSLAHMTLVAAIEDGFEIMLDAEDVVDMSSVAKAEEIVAKYV